MVNKNLILFLAFAVLLISIIIYLPNVNAVGEINFCCERVVSPLTKQPGAWCQNEPEANCATGTNPFTNQPYRKAPTSCEATGFCRSGTCVNVQTGECMESTPEIVCNQKGGVWDARDPDEIPLCQLGCCLIGEQAAFVTQTSCKQLSGKYGLDINFRADITDEKECIATATSDVKGACVITEQEFIRNCKITTQQECNAIEEGAEFHAGLLCSAPQLETVCGPSTKTTCLEDRDEVYYVDTCGNIANIYDATKQKNAEYWTTIKTRSESCNPNSANAGSSSCGSCDYFLGSTCKNYDRNIDRVKPIYGENVCRDLSCKWEGQAYRHGETWCASNSENTELPGSEFFRLVCYNSEVTIEPCDAFRATRCIESDIDGFSTAACRANRWQDCIAQDSEDDCLNPDKRDCEWINSGNLKSSLDEDEINKFNRLAKNDLGGFAGIGDIDQEDNSYTPSDYFAFVCTPKYPPGLAFWDDSAEDICELANMQYDVLYKADNVFDKPDKNMEDCDKNCFVISDRGAFSNRNLNWIEVKENMCVDLSDCGNKQNYINVWGVNNDEDSVTCDGGDCAWRN